MITEDFIDTLKSERKFFRDQTSLDALKDQLHLQDILNAVNLEAKSLAIQDDTASLQCLLKDLQAAANKSYQYVIDNLGRDPTIVGPSHESAKIAQRAFDTPELAEIILLNLDRQDLLAAEQVNKAFRGCIASSAKLLRAMYLQADFDCDWRSDLSTIWCNSDSGGVNCTVHHEECKSSWQDGEVLVRAEVRVSCDHKTKRLSQPKVSRRKQTTLICQPPITTMSATPMCCMGRCRVYGGQWNGPPHAVEIQNPNGIYNRRLTAYGT